MTTDANPRILSRSLARADAKKLIELASPLLEEIINYSTQVYMRCLLTGNSVGKEVAPFVLYIHIIEMTDGVHVLISQSCCEPAGPLIRSSFEAFLSLVYLMRDDYEKRCLAWLYFDYLESVKKYQRFDPESDRGKDFYEALTREMPSVTLPKLSAEHLARIRKISPAPHLIPIQEEYKRAKKRCRKPSWYTLYDGPRDLRELSRAVSMEGDYNMLYKETSLVTHAGDSSRYIETLPDGVVGGHQLRLAENLITYASRAGLFLWKATDLMLTKFRPPEPAHAKWTNEIAKRLRELSHVEVEVVRKPR